jgi:hypothetical protein
MSYETTGRAWFESYTDTLLELFEQELHVGRLFTPHIMPCFSFWVIGGWELLTF